MANGQGLLSQAGQAAAAVPPPAAGPPGAAPGAPPGTPAPGAGPPPPPAGGPTGPAGMYRGPETQHPASGMPGPQVSVPDAGPAPQGENPGLKEEKATEAEEREYERASGALERVLYREPGITEAIMKQISPEDKIGTTTKATALLIQQVDERVDMDEIVIPQITMDAVDAVTELAEQRYQMEYSEKDLQATLGATWESVMAMFGVDEADYQQMLGGISEDQIGSLKSSHEQFMGLGAGGMDAGIAAAQAAPPAQPAPPPGAVGPPQAIPGGPAGGAPPGVPPGGGGPPGGGIV